MQAYSDPRRVSDKYSLPDIEVWHLGADEHAICPLCSEEAYPDEEAEEHRTEHIGFYWQSCFPGCLPDSDPIGPFATAELALANARESAGLCAHGIADGDVCEECPAPVLWAIEFEEPGSGRFLHFSVGSLNQRSSCAAWATQAAAQGVLDGLSERMLRLGRVVRLSDHDARRWGASEGASDE